LGEWRYSSTHSLTSALDGGEWSASHLGRFTPRERAPGTHWIGGWVGPRAILDAAVKRKTPSPRVRGVVLSIKHRDFTFTFTFPYHLSRCQACILWCSNYKCCPSMNSLMSQHIGGHRFIVSANFQTFTIAYTFIVLDKHK
jgi:hypothetical protein